MNKCECWHKICSQRWDGWRQMMLPHDRYECWGTKEREECKCGGDQTKCDFYPEKREETKKPMNTAEMWLLAQQDDSKTYCTGDMAYSANRGLYDPDNGSKWPMDAFRDFRELMEYEWYELKIMTRAEAEAKLGVKIVG